MCTNSHGELLRWRTTVEQHVGFYYCNAYNYQQIRTTHHTHTHTLEHIQRAPLLWWHTYNNVIFACGCICIGTASVTICARVARVYRRTQSSSSVKLVSQPAQKNRTYSQCNMYATTQPTCQPGRVRRPTIDRVQIVKETNPLGKTTAITTEPNRLAVAVRRNATGGWPRLSRQCRFFFGERETKRVNRKRCDRRQSVEISVDIGTLHKYSNTRKNYGIGCTKTYT